jgi:hypothetical protein
MSFAKEVWTTLAAVDCSDKINKKGKMSYLSWAWAWAQLMNNYPESTFLHYGPELYSDGTATVRVDVTIRQGESELTRGMWMPVMDNRNNSIQNPTTRHVSDSTMRCLVKCLALFGLGLDLYAKSDMPVGAWEDDISDDQAELIHGLLKSSGADVVKFLQWLDAETVETIPANKYKMARGQLERKIKQASE